MSNRKQIQSKENNQNITCRGRAGWMKGIAAWMLVIVMIFSTAMPAWAQTSYLVCGMEEHTHTADCYDEDGLLTCTIPEHTHTADCYVTVDDDADTAGPQAVMPVGDPTADTETAQQWEETFADVELTGEWGADTVAIAKTQLDYRESDANFAAFADEDGNVVKDGYTRYAAWYTDDSDDYADWSAMFCSFCYHYAGVPEDQMPLDDDPADWMQLLDICGRYYTADSEYAPQAGDLIFFDTDRDGVCDRAGLVEQAADGRVYSIEGDLDGAVAEVDYAGDDESILGYGELPENPDMAEAEPTAEPAEAQDGEEAPAPASDEMAAEEQTDAEMPADGEQTEPALYTTVTDETEANDNWFTTLDNDEPEESGGDDTGDTTTQTAEDDGFRVTADYSDAAGLPEDAELCVTSIDPASNLFAEYAAEYEAATGMPMDFLLDVTFYADGEEAEPEAPVQITVRFTDEQAVEDTDPEILHFAEDGTEAIDSTPIDENAETSFTLDSFSLIAGTLYNGIRYDLSDDGVLTVSGNGALYYSSASSLPWYSNRTDIKKIVVEEGITGLGNYAFYGCSNVTEVQLPSTLTRIGAYDFDGCSSLTAITLPEGLTSIGRDAFDSCTALTAIEIPAGVTTIDSYTFYKCTSLTGVTLHEGLTTINSGAFMYCSALTDITLPETLTYIGGDAFVCCTALDKLTVPASVTGFGSGAVYDSYYGSKNGSTNVNIKDLKAWCGIDFRSYEYNPAYHAACLYLNGEKITDLVIPEGTAKIGNYAFYNNTALTSVTIQDGTTEIGTSAFQKCTGITSVTIPASVTSIGADAFNGCTGIKTVYFDGTATQWASIAKSNTYSNPGYNGASVYVKNADGEYVPYSATDVDMTGWTSIPDYCFYNAKNLTSIEIPDTVTSIGAHAFDGCTGLTSVTIPDSVTSIGSYAFNGCTGLTTAVLPSGLTAIPSYLFCGCSSLVNVNIPDGVTAIGDGAFQSCTKLMHVTLPDGVTSIGGYAFYYCSALTAIDLPDAVTYIGSMAFYHSGLQSIDFPPELKTIGSYAFEYSGITDYVIPDSVTTANSQGLFENFTVGANISKIPDYSLGSTCKTLTVRSRTLTSAGYSYTYSNTPTLTVIFDTTVDSVTQSAADSLKKYNYINVLFNGPNQLVLPNITTTTGTIAAGTYYADASGALYLLDTENKTAKLIRVPDGPESYTIPASVTGDEDITYTVTGIASNAFSESDDLTTLTIAAPGNITDAENFAFAGAENLASINGITEGAKVSGLFTAEGARVGSLLTFGTKLTDESTGTRTVDPVTTEYVMNADDVVKVIVSAADGNATPLNAGTDDTYRKYYTGVGYAGDITISNSANMSDEARDTVIHVYVAFDASEGTISPGEGSGSVTVDSSAVPYQVTKVQDGLYCIEIQVTDTFHKTVEIPFSVTYPNGSAGGGVKIWTEISDNDAADFTDAATADYQQVEWVTQPKTYQINKSSSTNLKFEVSGGTAYVGTCAYSIYPKLTADSKSSSYGSDIVTDISVTDTLTLDEDMEWADGVLDAVRKGNIYIKNPNAGVSGGWYTQRYIYATLDDGSEVQLFYLWYYASNDTYITLKNITASVVKDENGRDTVALTVTYSNRKGTDRLTEMNSLGFTLETGNRAIVLDKELSEALLGETYTLKNGVSETRSYLYSEDRTSTAEVEKNLQLSNYNFSFTKTASGTSTSSYGAAYPTYSLKLINSGNLPYTKVQDVYDTLDNRYYLSAAGMYQMLTDNSWGKYLTIDITDAYFETSSFTPEYVTLVNGNTSAYQTNTQDSGYGTRYGDGGSSGSWSTGGDALFISENSANYTDGTLKLYWQDDTCYIRKNDETPIKLTTAADLDAALDSMGYFVGAKTQFSVRWDLPQADESTGFTVPGNTTYTFNIYPTMKDTFMLLEQDHSVEYSSASRYQKVSNTGYADDTDGTHHSSSTTQITYNQDFTIHKAALLNGEETSTAGVGDVLTYNVSVSNAGSHYYEVLPWTDCMNGSQVLLAPVSTNTGLADKGLTVFTDDAGTQYYELTAGTYNDVWIGGKCADTVEVTDTSDGYRTLIHWYFQGKMSSSTSISYQALVMPGTMSADYDERTGFSLGNVTWLGDHQGHRIFCPITVSGHNMYHDKNIVTGQTDSGEDVLEKYSIVEQGNTVTYRLDIENRGGDEYTLLYNALEDELPLSLKATDGSWSWLWTADNVKVRYGSSAGSDGYTIKNPDSWYLTDGTRAGTTTAWQQYLRWNSNFNVVIEPGTTFYIYVELTFPENSGSDDYWTRYCEMNAGNDIQNTFCFLDMTDVVTHELGDSPVVQLQKGVLSTSLSGSTGDKNTGLYYYENGGAKIESDWYDAVQAAPRREVRYYTVIYNDGNTRLYLDELQDVLPEGFMPDTSSFAILQSGYVTLPDGTKLLTDTSANKVSATGTWDSTNKRGTLYISLTLDKSHYNSENGHYYLLPGEAIGFTYYVYTASTVSTEDIAVNTVGMSYYNYYNLPIQVTTADIAGSGRGSYSSSGTFTPNDGGCDVYTSEDVKAIGFKADRTTNQQWLVSSVQLTRTKIVPGIQKEAYKAVSTGGTTTMNPSVIHSGDKVTWKVTLMNDGDGVITGYTLTDTVKMYEDEDSTPSDSSLPANRFTGDICCAARSTSQPLFTITGWSDDGRTATIKTYQASGNSVSYSTSTCTLNSGSSVYAKVSLGTYYVNGGRGYSYRYGYIYLTLSTDEDNNMVLTIRAPEESISAGSQVVYYITTEQPSGTTRFGEISNCAAMSITQPFDPLDATHDDRSDDSDLTVTWSDSVWLLSSHMTYPEIQVTETADTTNYGIGSSSDNHIVLPQRDSEFYYTLTVSNSTNYNMQKLVMINNLPEVGDSDTYNAESKRDSAFKVVLDPDHTDFTVKVTDQDGKVTVLDPKYYTIEFSTEKNFAASADDWNGEITDDDTWIAKDAWTGDYDDIRSVRVVITDPAATIEDLSIIPKNSKITVDFNALVDDPYGVDEDGNYIAPDATIAWETFGYRYWMPGVDYLFAGSRKVGVEIPSIPFLTKTAATSGGDAVEMESDQTFRILIYTGSSIESSMWNADSLASTLSGRQFTVVDMTVPKGSSASDTIRLEHLKVWTVGSGNTLTATDTDWTWVTDGTYTAVELMNDEQSQMFNTGWEGSDYGYLTFANSGTAAVCVNRTIDFDMPSTGGSGTWLYTAGGLAMIGCAMALWIMIGRRRKKAA